jgi:hypothetical protein
MIFNSFKLVSTSVLLAALAACGGGGGDTPATVATATSFVAGGSPSAPVTISLTEKNSINANQFINYFKYVAEKDEKLFIHSVLNTNLTSKQLDACLDSTKINVYDESLKIIGGRCRTDMTFTAPSNGLFIFNFSFSSNAPGVFNVASVKGDAAITLPNGVIGTPGAPRQLSVTTPNKLYSEKFYNYYKFTIAGGKSLIVNTQLDRPLSAQQKDTCLSYMQIYIFNSSYERVGGTCSENVTFLAPTSGTYIIHFSFGDQSAGVFYANEI